MNWLGLLILLVGLYLLVLVVRGFVDFVAWIAENYFAGRRGRRGQNREAAGVRHAPRPVRHPTQGNPASAAKTKIAVPVSVAPARRPSPLAKLRKRLGLMLGSKSYDRWVTAALSEEDLPRKVEYLTKALTLNATYHPAWGLQANALFELGRFEEALGSFDKLLEMRPSALTWYRKGLCCHRLGRRVEALECFQKAIRTCHDDPQLRQDATRMKKLVENESTSENPRRPCDQGHGQGTVTE